MWMAVDNHFLTSFFFFFFSFLFSCRLSLYLSCLYARSEAHLSESFCPTCITCSLLLLSVILVWSGSHGTQLQLSLGAYGRPFTFTSLQKTFRGWISGTQRSAYLRCCEAESVEERLALRHGRRGCTPGVSSQHQIGLQNHLRPSTFFGRLD